jgi:hypothetical protein
MPKFQVAGSGRESGRARNKAYQANSEAHARSLAEADGMVVREVVELPPPPPTEGQLAKAGELGINVPAGITSEELSSLISLTTWRDKKADAALLKLAAGYGVAVNDYSGKKYLFMQIFELLSTPGRENDLVAWFAYRVYRELVHGAAGMPITSPHDPKIQAVASRRWSSRSAATAATASSGSGATRRPAAQRWRAAATAPRHTARWRPWCGRWPIPARHARRRARTVPQRGRSRG